MALVRVASVAQLGPGEVMEVRAGDRILAVCNVEGAVYALDGKCLHVGGPLGHGAVNGQHVVCPWHLWEFDCRTGACDFNPAHAVATYAVTVQGDDILVEVPGA
jgi:nitrite reductase (NADH) small subunit